MTVRVRGLFQTLENMVIAIHALPRLGRMRLIGKVYTVDRLSGLVPGSEAAVDRPIERGWAVSRTRKRVQQGVDGHVVRHVPNTGKRCVCDSRPPPIGAQTVVIAWGDVSGVVEAEFWGSALPSRAFVTKRRQGSGIRPTGINPPVRGADGWR